MSLLLSNVPVYIHTIFQLLFVSFVVLFVFTFSALDIEQFDDE